jgi:pilus assembly protein TadC
MRRVYGQSLGVTALKALGLLFAYGIILVAALVLLVMVTVAFG